MLLFSMRCSVRAVNHRLPPSFRRTVATVPRPKSASKSPSIPVTSSHSNVGSSRAQQVQMLAAQMLAAGRDEIYRNTASNGFVGASLGIMALSYCGIGYIYSTRLWEDEVAKAQGLHWLVPKAYQIVMICWGGFAAYAFSRTLGVVKSIKLVKNANKIFLETSIRRPVPFLRPEKHLSEPQDLIVNRARLFGSVDTEGMITAPEGASFLSRAVRTLFYSPFHNTRKSLGGVGLVPIQVGETGSQRHLMLDVDGQFSNGGQDLLDLSKDEI